MTKKEKFTLKINGNQKKFGDIIATLQSMGYSFKGFPHLDKLWDSSLYNFIYFTRTGEKSFDLTWGEAGTLARTKTTFETKEEILDYLNNKDQISADTILYMECEDGAETEAAKTYIENSDGVEIKGVIASINWRIISFNIDYDFFQIVGLDSINHNEAKREGRKYEFSQLKQFVQDAKKILELKSKKEIQLENGARVKLMESGIIQIGCKEYSIKSISLLIDLLKDVGFEKLESHDLTFGPKDAKEIEELIKNNENKI